jgi:hypothetical protein
MKRNAEEQRTRRKTRSWEIGKSYRGGEGLNREGAAGAKGARSRDDGIFNRESGESGE